jgi:hypothetical protein
MHSHAQDELLVSFSTSFLVPERSCQRCCSCQHCVKHPYLLTLALPVLAIRCAKDAWRKRSRALIQLAQVVVMAVLIGTAFLDLGHDQLSVNKRQALLFFCVINQVGGEQQFIE